MELFNAELIGINTKGKDPELIKSVIRCMGIEFEELDPDDDDDNIDHRPTAKGVISICLKEKCESFKDCTDYSDYYDDFMIFDRDITADADMKEYDMYIGYDLCDGEIDWFKQFSKELFAVLNKLLGETDICYMNIFDSFGSESSYNHDITEYRASDSKIYTIQINTYNNFFTEYPQKITKTYYKVSQETKDKLIENSTRLGYTELTAMILEKLR